MGLSYVIFILNKPKVCLMDIFIFPVLTKMPKRWAPMIQYDLIFAENSNHLPDLLPFPPET